MPRFVIQEHHQKDKVHFDFMLEFGDILKTWRVPLSPEQSPQTIESIGDHRKLYLDFEGDISGNRGFVKIWDKGEFEILIWSDELIEIRLMGNKVIGDYRLRFSNSSFWTFEK